LGVQAWDFHSPSKLTLVQTAARYGRYQAIEALLRHGFLPSERNGEGETALVGEDSFFKFIFSLAF